MSTLGLVQYNSQHRINVLQQTTNTNNNERREIIILRKHPQIVPQPKELSKEDVLLTNAARKKQKCNKETRAQNPPPVAVARRNARERNRVKQVNNGFANLRQHIPNAIAAAFESNSGRGGNKKLSKVETLRMAVEYIRSLEDILAMDDGEFIGNTSASSVSTYPSPTNSSSTITTQANMYNYPLLSPSGDEDDLSTNPTPPPTHYVRIHGTSSYQMIHSHLYDDSENLEPLDDELLSDPALMETDLDFKCVQDLSLLSSLNTNASLSPEMYSDHSLSPGSIDIKSEPRSFIPVFNTRQPSPEAVTIRISPDPELVIKRSLSSEELQCANHPVILPTVTEIQNQNQSNMIQVINWWEQQQNIRS